MMIILARSVGNSLLLHKSLSFEVLVHVQV